MTTMVRRNGPMSEILDWLGSGSAFDFRGVGLSSALRVEDYVEDGIYVVRAEMPGIDPEKDVKVTIDGDLLTIRGERREEKQDRNHHELHYGRFSRTLTIPRGVKADEVEARYLDGVLEVRVPAGERDESPTKVPVQRPES